MSLNRKQRQFVAEYLVDRNASQAAIRAGYSKKNCDSVSSRLLDIPAVQAAVDEKLKDLEAKTLVSAAYVVKALKEITERCMQRVPVMEFDFKEKELVQKKDPDTGEGLWEFDASGANRALELIGKHLKMFTERLEVEVNEGRADRLKAAREKLRG